MRKLETSPAIYAPAGIVTELPRVTLAIAFIPVTVDVIEKNLVSVMATRPENVPVTELAVVVTYCVPGLAAWLI